MRIELTPTAGNEAFYNYNILHIITQIKVFLKNGTGLGKY